jgi:hypothetical protein
MYSAAPDSSLRNWLSSHGSAHEGSFASSKEIIWSMSWTLNTASRDRLTGILVFRPGPTQPVTPTRGGEKMKTYSETVNKSFTFGAPLQLR